ncbi:MAG TPA: TCR/Tet family MFS transporter, partial [Opitutaceae bacterium]|nr:TCR/Tet family MFS transporter [Opitutaceae bacterium]
ASPILGALSDRFGRRRIILSATAGSAIDYTIMANAPTLGWLFVARMISGATAGILATANAYVVDVTPPEKRAGAFGMINAAFGLGIMLGPPLGGLLGHINIHLPFWFAAACSAMNWIWGFLVLPESLPPTQRRPVAWKRANPIGALLALRRFPAVFGLTMAYFMVYLSQTMMQSIWALYTQERYHWSVLQVGLSLMVAGGLMALLQATLVKHIVPRLGDTRAFIWGCWVWVLAFAAYGLASAGWMIYATMVFGTMAGIATPALQAYVTKHVPATEQGAVQGVFSGLGSLSYIPGPLIATWSFGWAVADSRRVHLPGIAFFEAGLAVLIGMVLALRSFRRDRGMALPSLEATEPATTA